MNIDSDMVKSKDVAGTTSDGNPVVFIETHGGLFAFFAKKDGNVQALGVGAHKAIAKYMAEKKDKGIKWDGDFISKKEEHPDELKKSEDRNLRIKKFMFSDELNENKEESDVFFVYHMPTRIPSVMKKEKLSKHIKRGFIDDSFLVRDVGLTTEPLPVSDHPSFKEKVDG